MNTRVFRILVAIVVLVSFLPLRGTAADAPVISNIRSTITGGQEVTISWSTNGMTTGKLEYGTASGQYSKTKNITEASEYQNVYLLELEYDTTYYYRITATNQSGTTISPEYSFTTYPAELKIVEVVPEMIGPTKVIIRTKTSTFAHTYIRYGTSPENPELVGGSLYTVDDRTRQLTMSNLAPNTTYYFRVYASYNQGAVIYSEPAAVTTTGIPEINAIEPDTGTPGTKVTIYGKHFGEYSQGHENVASTVAFGCSIQARYYAGTCGGTITSWTDTQITVEVGEKALTGQISVIKYHPTDLFEFFTADGPTFTVIKPAEEPEEIPAPEQDNLNVNTQPNTIPASNSNSSNRSVGNMNDGGVSKAFGCNFADPSATNYVRVSPALTRESERYQYIAQVLEAYESAWGRAPRCDEIQFHLDHSTPLTTLKEWLADQSITEKFDCQISTTVSDYQTLRIARPLTLGNDDDKYLSAVSQAYLEAWNRKPRCDELQFHVDHSTDLTRLKTWLADNIPSEENSPAVIVNFSENASSIILASAFPNVSDVDRITFTGTTSPTSTVLLTVASNPTTYTTKSNTDGRWSFTLPGPLEPGNHIVAVDVFDERGEKVRSSEPITFAVAAFETPQESPSHSTNDLVSDIPLYVWIGAGVLGAAIVTFLIIYFRSRGNIKM